MTNNVLDVITCKAAVVRELGGPVTVEEIKVDPPKASEVRVKMLCASICHTDILCCNGVPVPLFPRIPGHEGVGMVESVGINVKTGVKPGDIVMPLYLGECGECLNCKSGKTNICHAHSIGLTGLMPDGTSRMSMAATGETIYHHFSCSTWSEYMVIDINYVLKIDPKMPLPYASFLSCGFTTGFGAPWKETPIHKDSSVAVFGLGAVGLGVPTLFLAIKGAEMQGASKIIGVDINETKSTKGKVFGMTDFINPKDHPNQSVSNLVKDITDGLAAVVRELGGPVTVEEIKVDPPKASEVRIKMSMIESVGINMKTKVKPGDIVMPLYLGECGQCLNCKSGKTNICHVHPLVLNSLMPDGTSRMSVATTGETIYHHFSCSTWSEYMVIDINYVLKIDPKMPLPYASFLSCGFTTGFGAPWKETPIHKDTSVVVFGLGAVGLG
ncbi:Alcohol dehydrogenase GroES-like protein, partial [Cynara cardunculus var. scolymus]